MNTLRSSFRLKKTKSNGLKEDIVLFHGHFGFDVCPTHPDISINATIDNITPKDI